MSTLYIFIPLTLMAAILERPKRRRVYRKRRVNEIYWDR